MHFLYAPNAVMIKNSMSLPAAFRPSGSRLSLASVSKKAILYPVCGKTTRTSNASVAFKGLSMIALRLLENDISR